MPLDGASLSLSLSATKWFSRRFVNTGTNEPLDGWWTETGAAWRTSWAPADEFRQYFLVVFVVVVYLFFFYLPAGSDPIKQRINTALFICLTAASSPSCVCVSLAQDLAISNDFWRWMSRLFSVGRWSPGIPELKKHSGRKKRERERERERERSVLTRHMCLCVCPSVCHNDADDIFGRFRPHYRPAPPPFNMQISCKSPSSSSSSTGLEISFEFIPMWLIASHILDTPTSFPPPTCRWYVNEEEEEEEEEQQQFQQILSNSKLIKLNQ